MKTVIFASRRVARRRATNLEPILTVCRLSRRVAQHENHCVFKQTFDSLWCRDNGDPGLFFLPEQARTEKCFALHLPRKAAR
jgi:hypothetical protein